MVDELELEPEVAGHRTPPYISYKTFQTFLEDQKQHGVPAQIDRSVLTRFSGSVGTQLIGALKFLGLIGHNDQQVRAPLSKLVEAYGTPSWPTAFRPVMEEAYSSIVSPGLERMTPAQFHELFKEHYPLKDAVIRKCEVFFLNAAKSADIVVNERILKHRKPRSPSPKRLQTKSDQRASADSARGKNNSKEPEDHQDGGHDQPMSAYQMLIGILDPVEMEEEEQQAVWTLIRYLKRMETD